jgi:uncharacterized membrane protein YdjX (TVP38/TMEM64 family)
MKTLLVVLLLGLITLFYIQGGADYLSFTHLKTKLEELNYFYATAPFLVTVIFMGLYLLLTTLSIPGSLVLTILAGAIFGTPWGVVLVTTAGTIGACLSFVMSRYLFKDYLNQRFQRQFMLINEHLKNEGWIYLFAVRFIPASPFVVINLVVGLTGVRLWTFFWTTFLGMLPGNMIYAYAGQRIDEIASPGEIMTPSFLVSLSLLGILPLLARKIVQWRRKKLIPA